MACSMTRTALGFQTTLLAISMIRTEVLPACVYHDPHMELNTHHSSQLPVNHESLVFLPLSPGENGPILHHLTHICPYKVSIAVSTTHNVLLVTLL